MPTSTTSTHSSVQARSRRRAWRARDDRLRAREGRLRIAFDATPLLGPRAGVGEFCAGVLPALAASEAVELAAYAVTWRGRGRLAWEVPAGVPVAARAMPARPVLFAWSVAPWPRIEWWTGPVDVVHGTNFAVPPAKRAARVVTVHDVTALRFPELCEAATLRYPALLRRAVAEGAFVHTPSAFVAAEVVELLGADPGRVRVVPHGVPASPPADPASARHVLPAGSGRFVLALGTIEPRKDLPTLVRAFDLVAEDHPELALVVAGRDGWGTEGFEEALASARAAKRIVRLGYVDRALRAALVTDAAVLAYPSVYEGFGLPPLEAMARGTPVVATATGAIPEVLGDAAELVPVGDAAALAEGLRRVLDDEARRAELVARGRERVRSFSWERCARELVALYEDAASAR